MLVLLKSIRGAHGLVSFAFGSGRPRFGLGIPRFGLASPRFGDPGGGWTQRPARQDLEVKKKSFPRLHPIILRSFFDVIP